MGNFNAAEFFISPSSVNNNFLDPFFIYWTKASMSTMDGLTIMRSSTYVNNSMPFPVYKHGSIADGLKSLLTSDFLSSSYQLNLPCFIPYILLFNLRAYCL